MIAVCKSGWCNKQAGKDVNAATGIVKIVALGVMFCPDCRSVLVWKRTEFGDRRSAMSRYRREDMKMKARRS